MPGSKNYIHKAQKLYLKPQIKQWKTGLLNINKKLWTKLDIYIVNHETLEHWNIYKTNSKHRKNETVSEKTSEKSPRPVLGQSKYQFNQLILINHKKKFSIKWFDNHDGQIKLVHPQKERLKKKKKKEPMKSKNQHRSTRSLTNSSKNKDKKSRKETQKKYIKTTA